LRRVANSNPNGKSGKEPIEKPLWKGVFNFNREIYILYAHAYSEKQAWAVMCRRLADKTDVRWNNVTSYFNGEKDNYVIKRELPDGGG
jgi:hypothetical protein